MMEGFYFYFFRNPSDDKPEFAKDCRMIYDGARYSIESNLTLNFLGYTSDELHSSAHRLIVPKDI